MPNPSQKKKRVGSRLVGVTLINVELDIEAFIEDENLEFSYNCTITKPEALESGINVFKAEFIVSATNDETKEKGRSVSATYLCGIKYDAGSRENGTSLAKKYAETSIWGSFTSLFSILIQQMGFSFPLLPPSPVGVKVKSDEDTIDVPKNLEGRE